MLGNEPRGSGAFETNKRDARPTIFGNKTVQLNSVLSMHLLHFRIITAVELSLTQQAGPGIDVTLLH